MLTSVRLVDGAREMNLLPRQDQGVYLQGLDAPMPSVREVAEDRTDDDGSRDTTSLFGARACSIELLVTSGARAVEDELSRFLHPRSRPYLVVEDDEWSQPRRLGLRVDQFSAPLGVDLPRRARKIQAQWKCPDGVWEAADLASSTVGADVVEQVGFSLPFSLPFSLVTTVSTGAATIGNVGAVPSHLVARLYGPCSGPSLRNETTGEEITFLPTLALAVGEYVEIDTREQTAYLLSMSTASRLNYIDFAQTSWWRLEPGDNEIRYAPSGVTGAAAAVIEYRPAWL
ncbi:phage distal tail protein [Actinomadura litoris]|uniref:phage distal tail protein n=1 Tax=Actinomadura litoris TaxID=2678616 RepID=UPI001FA7EB8B|nr:phage tail domain-containing protein [Actinomadura litoris]